MQQRTSGSVIDIQLDKALAEANALSIIAKSEGDLPTMYLANQAWRKLYAAREDIAKRRMALSRKRSA